MLPETKVWEQQQSPGGRKQEGHNLGPTSRDGGGPRSQAQAAAESTPSKHIPGCENNADLI